MAGWLHRAIETYRLPRRMWGRESRLGPLAARLPPVFRDREELAASSDLAQSVRAALADSASLIVVCSPFGAQSRWVNEEIRTFTALGRRDAIQCLIVAGQPHASRTPGEDPALECLPPALFEDGGQEPLAADIRPGQDTRTAARLKLLAGVMGVPFDELRQREQARRNRQLAIASTLLSLGFVTMSGLAAAALLARNEAVRQRDIARQKTMTAERTVAFVKSLFEVSDPSESKGQTITAREILDRGARRIDQSLNDEPSVKAELSATLGEVYAGLGLFKQGEGLISRSLGLKGVEVGARARQYTALADAQSRAGDYDAALVDYRLALKYALAKGSSRSDLAARILDGIGEAESGLNAYSDAERDIRKALALDTARLGLDHPDVARDLEALATNAQFAGRPADAKAPLERALTIRRRAEGELHPRVAEDLLNLGALNYLQRRPSEAEAYYRQALRAAVQVLGADHPDVALIENNLGRLFIERRDYVEARPIMEHSVRITAREHGETYDDLAFGYDNLGLARRGMGDLPGAETAFRAALTAAQLHKHRNLGPVMVDLADARCARGAAVEGLRILEQARPIVAHAYAKDPWRMAWLEVVRAQCLTGAGRTAAARAALEAARPDLAKRWGPDTLYGARMADLAARLG